MKLLLDENITPKAKDYLSALGHDVNSIQSLGLHGINDNDVLRLATTQERVLLTHNGKHFVIKIPPKFKGVQHYGLLWLKYEITKINASNICNKLDDFFKNETSYSNTIWIFLKRDETFLFEREFPKGRINILTNII